MTKALATIIFTSGMLSACISQPYKEPLTANDLKEVQNQIEALESKLSTKFNENCSNNIFALNADIQELKRAKATTKVIERCSSPQKNKPVAKIGDKLLIGEIEKVTLIKEAMKLNARIDSGAVTSSIGVYNAKSFERDGDKWVRFSLKSDDNAKTYEYPVYDTVNIKQTSQLSEERIEIKIDIKVGSSNYKNQVFNLADRSHLDFQLLIGRSFLKDRAVIDVGSKFLMDGQ